MRRLILALACWLLWGGISFAVTCNIKPRVCMLTNPDQYDPAAYLHDKKDYVSPGLDCKAASLTDYKQAIQALIDDKNTEEGFNTFRAEICALTNMVVSAKLDRSYGKYEDPNQNQSGSGTLSHFGDGSTYVLLQPDILSQDAVSFYSQSLGELRGKYGNLKSLVKEVKHTAKGNHQKKGMPSALTMALAHEIGHIRFHRDKTDQKFLTCFGPAIESASWQKGSTPDPNTPDGRWRPYDDERFGVHLDTRVPKPNNVETADGIALIYTQGFASALAAASTEEDYVESYMLAVLTAFSSDDLDIDLDKSGVVKVKGRHDTDNTLKAKLDCVNSW